MSFGVCLVLELFTKLSRQLVTILCATEVRILIHASSQSHPFLPNPQINSKLQANLCKTARSIYQSLHKFQSCLLTKYTDRILQQSRSVFGLTTCQKRRFHDASGVSNLLAPTAHSEMTLLSVGKSAWLPLFSNLTSANKFQDGVTGEFATSSRFQVVDEMTMVRPLGAEFDQSDLSFRPLIPGEEGGTLRSMTSSRRRKDSSTYDRLARFGRSWRKIKRQPS